MNTRWKSRLHLALVGIFLTTSLVLLILFNTSKPRIMVVHSLSSESSWTSAIDRGFDQVLASNRLPIVVRRHYLNLDILSEGISPQALSAEVLRKIDRLDPHVLIVVDDESSDLIGRHYVGKQHPRIVYTGLMHAPERYGYTPASGVWGLQEDLPLQGITALLDQVFPDKALDIAVLGVSDLTGTAEMAQVLRHNWGRHRIARQALVPDYPTWQSFVRAASADAQILLVLTADKLPAKAQGPRMTPESEVASWTEENATPWPIGIRASFVSLGGGMALSPSPAQHGSRAMALALERMAHPEPGATARHLSSSSYDVAVRPLALTRRGIVLPDIYTEAARAAGQRHE